MTALVTGAAGFIGFHVVRALLDRGESVLGIDDMNAYYAPELKAARLAALPPDAKFRFRPVDIADDAALDVATRDAGIDRIIHLAAQAGVRHSIDNPRAYARSNLLGHLNLLELAREHRVAHLVYASSSSVYGDAQHLPLSLGERADRPISLYAATKRADELMSESYAHLYRVPMTGLRFFTVYGPWGRPDMAVWLFTAAILAGDPVRLHNDGAMARDFTFIDDIVAGVLAALDAPPADDGAAKAGGSTAPHALYNLGGDRPEPLDRLLTVIESACGRRAARVALPMQAGDVHATAADISETVRHLGWRPTLSIDDGIPRFVDWYRAQYRV